MAEEVCKKVNPFAYLFLPLTPFSLFSIFNAFSMSPYLCKRVYSFAQGIFRFHQFVTVFTAWPGEIFLVKRGMKMKGANLKKWRWRLVLLTITVLAGVALPAWAVTLRRPLGYFIRSLHAFALI
jgi:hypothetical protein